MRRHHRPMLAALLLVFAVSNACPAAAEPWSQVLAQARGQIVYWDTWAGDQKTNDFIAWVGRQVAMCCAITLRQVPLQDTSEAVAQVIAEKTAGRNTDGTVDLIWINGANFLALKKKGLLYGPFTQALPNAAYVDRGDASNWVDFTVPVEGYESPWRKAQLVFIYDSAYVKHVPHDIQGFLGWVRRHPGRFTHPEVSNFLGMAFLTQALYDLAPDPTVLGHPATAANIARATAPLWAWYDRLRPFLWRHGREFPASGPAERELLDDGEIDMMISFNPEEAAADIESGLLPRTVRTFVLDTGTLGNTSFVAIPYNSPHKAGAMVVANFLLSPQAQARAADVRHLGDPTVLDVSKLSPQDQARFETLPGSSALPPRAALGRVLPEPNPSWMRRIAKAWAERYTG